MLADTAMVDGCLSLMGMHYTIWGSPFMDGRGAGLLSGGAPFYRCFACKDGKYVAVGALEKAFFQNLWNGLSLGGDVPDHMDPASWPAMTELFEQAFLEKTRDDWSAHFYGKDACVTPVLDPAEAWRDAHVSARHPHSNGRSVPIVPRLGSAPLPAAAVDLSDRTAEVLADAGFSDAEIAELTCVPLPAAAGGLEWPSK